jgi:hypothetical protein
MLADGITETIMTRVGMNDAAAGTITASIVVGTNTEGTATRCV